MSHWMSVNQWLGSVGDSTPCPLVPMQPGLARKTTWYFGVFRSYQTEDTFFQLCTDRSSFYSQVKPTQPLKTGLPNMKMIFQPSIFRGYVSFKECISSIIISTLLMLLAIETTTPTGNPGIGGWLVFFLNFNFIRWFRLPPLQPHQSWQFCLVRSFPVWPGRI